ncbi:MAG: 23S rRNA (pseudouridine(1915)-N(3))-methyltransferase RlmH [Desulforhopalus sp.]
MKHELLFLGKTKDKYIVEGIEHYLKRLCHYTSLNVTTLKEKGRGKSKTLSKEEEGHLLLQAVPQGAKTVVLDSRGRQFTSFDFAKQIGSWEMQGIKQLCYLIGGPEGHSQKVTSSADLLLSFSKMTFTHDMMRLLLVEQLYRAYTIKAGEKYHK